MNIRTYPDQVLRVKCEAVSAVDSTITSLAKDMLQTMYDAEGIGLAAPQIGETIRLFVADTGEPEVDTHCFINPVITAREGTVNSEEGCLSIPGFREVVKRSEKITVAALNEEGEEFSLEADGLLARCIQHEIDHLDGVLIIDHLSRLKRELFKRRYHKKLKE